MSQATKHIMALIVETLPSILEEISSNPVDELVKCQTSAETQQMLEGANVPQFWTDLSALAGTFEAQRSA